MRNKPTTDQSRLFYEISMLDFVVVDLIEYLDTHPNDKEALEYFNHFNRMKNQAMKDYAMKYGPLVVSLADDCRNEWKWGAMPLPWEGVC